MQNEENSILRIRQTSRHIPKSQAFKKKIETVARGSREIGVNCTVQVRVYKVQNQKGQRKNFLR